MKPNDQTRALNQATKTFLIKLTWKQNQNLKKKMWESSSNQDVLSSIKNFDPSHRWYFEWPLFKKIIPGYIGRLPLLTTPNTPCNSIFTIHMHSQKTLAIWHLDFNTLHFTPNLTFTIYWKVDLLKSEIFRHFLLTACFQVYFYVMPTWQTAIRAGSPGLWCAIIIVNVLDYIPTALSWQALYDNIAMSTGIRSRSREVSAVMQLAWRCSSRCSVMQCSRIHVRQCI